MNGGVTVGVGLLVATVAVCIWVFGDRALPRTVALGVLTASVGLTSTKLGELAHTGVTWVNSKVGRFLGGLLDRPDVVRPGAVTWSLAAVALLLFVGFRFWKAKVDLWVLAGMALIPAAAATIPGTLGEVSLSALKTVASVFAWPITALLGL